MKKLLGLVFNRWVALTLLLAALLALVWIVGPLVAIGQVRPLETATARWIGMALLVTLTVIWLGLSAWRKRRGNERVVERLVSANATPAAAAESADMVAIRERFQLAMQTLRKARFGAATTGGWFSRLNAKLGGRYLYELPWYLIIGAPGSGKTTALRNSGLQFPLAAHNGEQAVRGVGGTRNCDWWFTDRAVLIDTAGRFVTQDSDAVNDKATWTGFLSLLKTSRPRQPLNGVIVTVSVPDLLAKGAAERAAYAQAARQRVQELHEQLRIRFPIYLLVTKCDLMAGFGDTFGNLDKEQRATPWGVTFPRQTHAAWTQGLGSELQALLQRLTDGLIDRLQAEPDAQRRMRIYGFPNQFAQLVGPLQDFVQQVFSPSPFEEDPLLRGVYFVSGTQEGTPVDRVLGAVARRFRVEQAILPPQQASGRSFFLQRLLSEVMFPESGLAGTDKRWERRRSLAVAAGYGVLAVLAVGTLGAWVVSWQNNSTYVAAVSERVQTVRRQVQETPNRNTSDLRAVLPALDATRSLAAAGGSAGDVPWSLGFGLFQGKKLDGAARAAYERMLVDAVLPRLALRVEEQLRVGDQPEAQYEALKAYLMMFDPARFDAQALKSHLEADWDNRLGRELASEQRETMSRHLDALLALGPTVSPLEQDKALVEATRQRLAATPLAQRVYNRMRQSGLGNQFPEFTVVRAGGPNAQLVFVRASGQPLSRGVPGLFTHEGYTKGFQSKVGDVTRQLAQEQTWVLGAAAPALKVTDELLASAKLTDDVRRLYLTDYRDTWKGFIADIRLQPLTSVAQSLEKARFLSAPDTPLVPLLRAISRETTLLESPGALGKVDKGVREIGQTVEKILGKGGLKPSTTGAPGERIESIVDDEFVALRRFVTAPEGGRAPLEGVVERLRQLQDLLSAVDAALKGGAAPPQSPLPNQMKVEAANSPEPVRSVLDSLGSASARVAQAQLRDSLSREVRSLVGEFCNQAVTGRYPFDANSPREVTQADFAALFGPGGKFEQMQTKLAPYIDTSKRPWSFRAVDGVPLGTDVGTLPQFQRAAVIRETFFAGGSATPTMVLEFKPVEMDTSLREFLLDADGQTVRYDHGPQLPKVVRWPGPRGTGVVRVSAQPAGSTGMVSEGPWAMMRLLERVALQPGSGPEKFRATFDIDGRRAVFDITASSVRSPLRLAELRTFACPNGL
jgi:type VI secretion system protein ImpL